MTKPLEQVHVDVVGFHDKPFMHTHPYTVARPLEYAAKLQSLQNPSGNTAKLNAQLHSHLPLAGFQK